MIETFKFLSIQILLLAVVTSVHTYIGMHIIRRGIVFSDLSLDQLAALGVIVGIGLGVDGGSTASYFVSFIAVLVGSFLLAFVRPKNKQIPHEAVIGIIYGAALVACIMVADKFTAGMAYVTQTLAGCMLWVTWPLVMTTVVVYIILGIFHYICRHRFIAITEQKQKIDHEPLWDLLFFITQGIITVLIVPIAGVLLAYAFLMIPAAISLLFTRQWGKGLIMGWAIGFIASMIGMFASYYFRFSYGPSLVLSMGFFFIAALLIRMIRPQNR
ncbi:metal ABC transporter permease [bacterium]|nr:metal ABC transporter permease [bacterium]